MVHKMGLLTASVPAASTADNVIVYNGNTYNSGASGEKWTRITAECTTVTWNASTTFTSSTNKPYKSGSTLFYMARPGDSSVSISASSGTQLYAWSVSGAATTTGSSGTYKAFTIASPDYTNAFNKKIWKFSYSGTCQQWVAPHAGSYTMECWGAQGGDQSRTNYASGTGSGPTPYGGRGAYVSGQIVLSDQTTLYVYVGEEGGYNNTSTSSTFNGGGYGGDTSWRPGGIDGAGSRGGGATDIRSIKHSGSDGWSGNTSLLSRIIVAAGGGGCTTYGVHGGRTGDGSGGAAGGLIGYSGSITVYGSTSTAGCTPAAGGSQVGGGLGFLYNGSPSYSQSGGLGYGNGSINFGSDGHRDPGGGSGLYGGGSGGIKGGSPVGSAAGGSSFISGHPGCATITGYTFTSTKMIDGKGLSWTTAGQTTGGSAERMPTTSGGQEALNTGHSGDGYTIITYVKP